MIRDSGYHGPIGILDHREDTDAEVSLRANLDGLKKLLLEMGETEAANPPEISPRLRRKSRRVDRAGGRGSLIVDSMAKNQGGPER